MNADVIVIGGGAAGMTAAATAAHLGAKVICLERNDKFGKKLNITGKGRCNLTNNSDNDNIIKHVPTNARFLYGALAGFSARDTMEYFEKTLGVPLKTERGGRVFPVSDRAADITDALCRDMREAGVRTVKCRAEHIIAKNGAVSAVTGGGGSFYAPAVILATGGMSYPATGSTGDGYRMAAELGHEIIPPKPMLVPVETREDCSKTAGLTLKNVRLTLLSPVGKTLFCEQGEMLFTHFGASGPLVLSASAFIREEGCKLSVDMKPALDEKTLDARILRDFSAEPNRALSNVLKKLLPQAMIHEILSRAGINGDIKANSVTREQRRGLLAAVKRFELSVKALRPIEEAVITDGGISVKQIDPKTMQSKLVKGLYFAGEIIDCAAYTGGYNLQIAFSTARAAGKFAARSTVFS